MNVHFITSLSPSLPLSLSPFPISLSLSCSRSLTQILGNNNETTHVLSVVSFSAGIEAGFFLLNGSGTDACYYVRKSGASQLTNVTL